MVKTIDRALADGIWDSSEDSVLLPVYPPTKPEFRIFEPALAKLAKQAAVYEVTNVQRLVANDPRAYIFEDLFPSLAPPKSKMWFEWDSGTGRGTRRAMLLEDTTAELDDPDTSAAWAAADARSNLYLPCLWWALLGSIFVDDRVVAHAGGITVVLNKDGRIVGNHYKAASIAPEYGPDWLLRMARVPFTAISLMHARNTVVVEDPDPSPKLARRHARRHGRPLVRLSRVHLQLPRPRGAKRGSPHLTTESFVGSHSVDGHFAHYGDCCPESHPPNGLLFGKYTGVVWVSSHVRGDASEGVIIHPERTVDVEPAKAVT